MSVELIGKAEVHDSVIEDVEKTKEKVVVRLRTQEGKLVEAVFLDYHMIEAENPDGMILYSIIYKKEEKCYEFVNWDEESKNYLRIYSDKIIFNENCKP